MDLFDEDPDLELDEREYICGVCQLVHWGPTGPAACDRQ